MHSMHSAASSAKGNQDSFTDGECFSVLDFTMFTMFLFIYLFFPEMHVLTHSSAMRLDIKTNQGIILMDSEIFN